MSPKISPWKRFRLSSLTEQCSSVCLETFSGTANLAACGELILVTLFRPVDGGCYPEAYLTTMALSSEGLFVPSQVTFHNVAPWSHPSSSSGCGAREWQGGEHGTGEQGSWVSTYFPGHLPRNSWMFPRKRSLSLRKDSKMTASSGSALTLQLALSSWDWLGAVVAYLSHL